MARQIILRMALTLVAAGCETQPLAPTIIPTQPVPAVATARTFVWDNDVELTAWVNNGASAAPGTVAGTGNGAVIQLDVSQGSVRLNGPSLDPAPSHIRAARLRYRWLGRVDDARGELLLVTMHLRPPQLSASLDIPRLFFLEANSANMNAGNWVEYELTSHGLSTPPYTVLFAALTIDGSGTYAPTNVHGTVEIDWIALVP